MKQFQDRLPGEAYLLVAAGSGARNIELPDGTITSCEEVKTELGYPQLLAWMNERKELDNWVEKLRTNPDCKCKLIVDSSAYSASTIGMVVDIDEYIEYINSISDVVYWFAALDKIPGENGEPPTPQQIADAPRISWENYLYMIERVNCPKKIVPVFHAGEDIKYLKQMLEFTFPDGSHIEYMGLGGIVGARPDEIVKWYESIWPIIKSSSNPDIKVHNFGMTSTKTIEQFPSMSSDSTSWLKFGIYGSILIPIRDKVRAFRCGNRCMLDNNHILNQQADIKAEAERICKLMGHGMSLDALVNEEKNHLKLLFNLYSLNEWRKKFEYKGNDFYKVDLW